MEFNIGTFNIPTVVGLLTIIGMIWSQSSEYARRDAEQELRIANIEQDRSRAKIANDQRLADLTTTTSVLPNLTYRQTVTESGLAAVNSRVDRVTDAMDSLRGDIADIGTKIEVLTQKIEMSLPLRKSDLNSTPQELRRTP